MHVRTIQIFCYFLMFGSSTFSMGQGATSIAANPAIAVIRRSIMALGGEGWTSVGASTVQSTLLYPGGNSVTATKRDDWSRGAVYHRRDINGATVITASEYSHFISNSKITKTVPASYDLVALSEVSPAIALKLAIARKCFFQLFTPSSTLSIDQIGAVAMNCRAPNYPGQLAHFTWWFDSEGRPSQIEVPLLSADGQMEIHQMLRITRYKQVSGLTVPAEVQILVNGVLAATEKLGDVELTTSIPSTAFSVSSAK